MKTSTRLLGFGLLPLWLAIIAMFLGWIVSDDSYQYSLMAPWVLIPAIPACIVTLLIAALFRSGRQLAFVIVSLFLVLGALWGHGQYKQMRIKRQQAQVEQFVRAQLSTQGFASGKRTLVGAHFMHMGSSGWPVAYEVSVVTPGSPSFSAKVDVTGSRSRPQFHFHCFTSINSATIDWQGKTPWSEGDPRCKSPVTPTAAATSRTHP